MSASDPEANITADSHQCHKTQQPNYSASVFVLGRLRTPPVRGITHIAEYKDGEGSHALPLFGTERLVERLPRLGELIQLG